MKITIPLLLLTVASYVFGIDQSYTIPFSGHIVIDGQMGEWEKGLYTSVHLFTDEFGYLPESQDLDPELRISWSNKGLQVAVRVNDDVIRKPDEGGNIFTGDCLELFVCDRVGGKNLMQYILSPFQEEVIWDHRGTRALQAYPGEIHFASRIDDTGYIIEALIPFSQIGIIPGNDQLPGFQINFIDRDVNEKERGRNVKWFYAKESYYNSYALYPLKLEKDVSCLVDHNLRAYFEGDSLQLKLIKGDGNPSHLCIRNHKGEILFSGKVDDASAVSLPFTYSAAPGEILCYEGEELLGTIHAAFISTRGKVLYPNEQYVRILNYREKVNPAPEDPIVLVGHSMIRYWYTLEDDLQGFPVVNKGFGGSQASHVNHFYEVLIKPIAPAMIIYYEGGNDIRTGKEPRAVAGETEKFILRVSADFPHTKIALVSHQLNRYTTEVFHNLAIVDSLHNHLAHQYPQVDFIDATHCLIGENQKPYEDIYLPDNRHLNHQGYLHFAKPIREYLEENYISE